MRRGWGTPPSWEGGVSPPRPLQKQRLEANGPPGCAGRRRVRPLRPATHPHRSPGSRPRRSPRPRRRIDHGEPSRSAQKLQQPARGAVRQPVAEGEGGQNFIAARKPAVGPDREKKTAESLPDFEKFSGPRRPLAGDERSPRLLAMMTPMSRFHARAGSPGRRRLQSSNPSRPGGRPRGGRAPAARPQGARGPCGRHLLRRTSKPSSVICLATRGQHRLTAASRCPFGRKGGARRSHAGFAQP